VRVDLHGELELVDRPVVLARVHQHLGHLGIDVGVVAVVEPCLLEV
jgi:hypothetical protein